MTVVCTQVKGLHDGLKKGVRGLPALDPAMMAAASTVVTRGHSAGMAQAAQPAPSPPVNISQVSTYLPPQSLIQYHVNASSRCLPVSPGVDAELVTRTQRT
jgi:hypothetical protein